MLLRVIALSLLFGAPAVAADLRIGFFTADASPDAFGPETRAAHRLAAELGAVTLVHPTAETGTTPLDRCDVIWIHHGDSIEQNQSLRDAKTVTTIREFVSRGRGLFLSGAALAWIGPLGVETARTRYIPAGKDTYVAQLLPVVSDHPVFAGMNVTGVALPPRVGGNKRVFGVPITDRGRPAGADLHGSGGPHGGMLLARAASSTENPLVEYQLGGGRVIAMGWRLPHYANRENAHKANLERLTANILGYLADSESWREITLTKQSRPSTRSARPAVPAPEWRALELAIEDLIATFGPRYAGGTGYLARLKELRRRHDSAGNQRAETAKITDELTRLREEALFANPLLDFDRLLVVERSPKSLGLPANWQSNSSLRTAGYDNRLAVLSPVRPEGELTTLLRPEGKRFIGDVDLHFDADRVLFSMPGTNDRWQVLEMALDGSAPRQLSLIEEPDVDNYDACYLPDGSIIFSSTAPFIGVPCVNGNSHVANLYVRKPDGSIRQLTVDQEHSWCPEVMNDGRVLYQRWEYVDLPHSNSRLLFTMNPDGTRQMEYYGSNSFFPNSFFYARPIPGHPTKVVGIATGHHGVARAGRLLILDPTYGHVEADGVVQEIPGRGKKVEARIYDALVDGVWPQFLHPYPLSEKYFLVSAKPSPGAAWGIYLVDVFDNLVLVKESPGYALLEPVPVRPRPAPPTIPDRVDPQRTDAVVYLADIYQGEGLEGIPRGAVKALRLVTFQFSYRGMGGLLGAIGMDGPWDVKRVIGTVPVEPDGSASFRVPANTPISLQPLDSGGRSLQVMRSWFTAMPGESLACSGCHERQSTETPSYKTLAASRPVSEIEPWYGPVRGFSFAREVQPVLDEYCVGCHGGETPADGTAALVDLRGDHKITDWSSNIGGHSNPAVGGKFSVSYTELHRYVRRPGIESDIRLQVPMEFHASTTELVQMLEKGHHGVELDEEAWDRLNTWIDLNAPYHGTWGEIVGKIKVQHVADRARAMRKTYAGIDEDLEAILPVARSAVEPVVPEREPVSGLVRANPSGSVFDAEEARRRQVSAGEYEKTIDLGGGVTLELRRIPAGRFRMGSPRGVGVPDERGPATIDIDRAFWIGQCEITNEQFTRFDPSHDSRVEPMHGYQFGIRGYPVDGPRQPAVRLSWQQAMAFCEWLGQKTGERFTLPTEAQWEYACRAGTATDFWYGDGDTDFSEFANLGDATLGEFAIDTFVQVRLVANPNRYDDWVPKDKRFDDGGFVSVDVGQHRPNPWGLHDMHGNVQEWTRSAYRPYPYDPDDGRDDPAAAGKKVVRGGSWYDRPHRCRSGFRLAYEPFQRVFNVGFRVVLEEK